MEKQNIETNLDKLGFQLEEKVFTEDEINKILKCISQSNLQEKFGVRYFLKNHPALYPLIFTKKLKRIIKAISPKAFVVKSIYFDKPPNVNWIVNWHQDLMINVKGSTEEIDFTKWRKVKERVVVQPPLKILENIFTLRIHLDDCSSKNGALRVVPFSHKKGIIKSQVLQDAIKDIEVCEIKKGGVLIMKPLILHSSRRSENEMNRRVIHIEFSSMRLPKGVEWLEKYDY